MSHVFFLLILDFGIVILTTVQMPHP